MPPHTRYGLLLVLYLPGLLHSAAPQGESHDPHVATAATPKDTLVNLGGQASGPRVRLQGPCQTKPLLIGQRVAVKAANYPFQVLAFMPSVRLQGGFRAPWGRPDAIFALRIEILSCKREVERLWLEPTRLFNLNTHQGLITLTFEGGSRGAPPGGPADD